MKTYKTNVRIILSSFISTWLICTPAWADDTEIYVGGSTNVTVKPNVLFILDTSGSMTSTDGGSSTRLDRMKTALNDILNSAQDINVGLMRFSNPGGPILYPVTDIDQAIVSTIQQDALSGSTTSAIQTGDDDAEQASDFSVNLTSTTLDMTTVLGSASTSISVRVNSSDDDAEQRSDNSMYLTSGDLELMNDGGTQVIGIRFNDVNVPQGAIITNAWLEFEVDEQNAASASAVTVLISGQDSDDANTFTSSNSNISNRTKTTATSTWAITDNPAVDTAVNSPGINAIVQEIVNRGSWASNNSMAFIIEHVNGSGIRWFETYNGESSAAPQLHITYTTGTATSVTAQVSSSFDDAEEAVSNGSMDRTSSDLELMDDGGTQIIGMRFASVNIPAGATIADARLEFEIDEEYATSSDPITVRIYAENADNPGSYSSTNHDISNRTKTTASTLWAITENPAKDNALISPNINNAVQEVIDRSGWAATQAMTFIIEYVSGSGVRWVESENGESSAAPKLHITYTTGTTSSGTQTIGLRFNDINIPQGATISSAALTFTADNSNSDTSNLLFYGEDTDNSSPFMATSNNLGITSRPRTSANVGWNAAGTLGPWTNGSEYTAPDLTTIIQEIVNRTGWCGGNSTSLLITGSGLRIAKSYENDPSQAPKLAISYDPSSAPTGCMNYEFGIRINSSSDDAEQNSSGNVNLNSSDLELVTDSSTQTIGMRFNNVQLNQGSTIASAYLEFAVDETDPTAATSLTIKAEAVGNSATFTTAANNISSRTTTSASANWSITDQWSVEHEIKRSVDIAPLVNEVLARGDWIPGNSMSFIITGSGERVAESYDGSNLAPRLVYYTNPANVPVTSNTVRSKLIEEVNNLEHKSGTPIVDSLYEAALYYRGDAVDYGKTRGSGTTSRADTRVSHPDSYTGGTLVQPVGCSDENLGSDDCAGEAITGTPMYTSPIIESCQSNHIVLLTDGQASVNTSASKVQTLTGASSCVDSGSKACGPELVSYLKNNDQLPISMADNQTITTHTIGFNFSDQWLHDLATTGGGGFYEAESAAQLTSAFDTIIKTIKAVNTTFVQPSVTINQFNRFSHRDDVYFSLFKPQETAKWHGNLKKYQLKGNPATLYDNQTPQQPAIDPLTGFFGINSQSFWSADEDGNAVEKGGAASKLPSSRKLYSNVSSNAVLSVADNALHENNALVSKTLLDTVSKSDAYRTDLLQWARGLDANGAQRFSLGDPLHSRPELVTYDGLSNPLESSIFFGTNEGFLHAVDITSGIEQFAFIPKELLENLDTYYTNASTSSRPYGMDGHITLWTKDVNKDGDLKDSGDFAYLYVGMRRGGNNYYALNVTDINNPTLMWQISGGTGDFVDLGQTWSKPIKTKIKFQLAGDTVPTVHDVLIFGGGYDPAQDSVTVRTADTVGNAIFMVDALTGALVWSAGNHNGHDESHADMDYSIPSTIAVIDMNRDGMADQLYVGDMGGQIWRMDIDNSGDPNNINAFIDITKIADLGGSNAASNRRFYYPPDLALAVDGKERYLSLAIGSGFRAHPLDTAINDRFYMLKLFDTHAKPSSWTTLTETDLYDATDNDIGGGDATLKAAAEVALSNTDISRKQGWYLRMANSGEKVLSSSATIQNQIVFTSYEPNTAVTGSCNPTQGTSRAYLVSLFDATPKLDIDQDGTITAVDRVIQLQIGSIPATPTVIDTLDSKPTVWVGPERLDQVDTDVESSRTYWIEESN